MHRARTGAMVLTGALALGLAACSSSATSSSSSSGASTTVAGQPFSSQGFTTVIPTGWSNHPQSAGQAPTGETPVAVFENSDSSAAIAIFVVSSAIPQNQMDSALAAGAQSDHATGVGQPQSFALAGSQGRCLAYHRTGSGGEQEQTTTCFVPHGSRTYIFSTAGTPAHASAAQDAFSTVTSSWHWTS